MKYSGVGGQAVMEGVMMKNGDQYAVAVRKPDGQIEVKVDKYKGPGAKNKLRNIPIVRGVISFIDSLYLGMSTLMYSSSFYEEEEELTEKQKEKQRKKEEGLTQEEIQKKKEKEDKALRGRTVTFSMV